MNVIISMCGACQLRSVMLHPLVDAMQMPSNFVAPGRDRHLYIVKETQEGIKEWKLYHLTSQIANIIAHREHYQVVEYVDAIVDANIPDVQVSSKPTQEIPAMFATNQLPEKRGRGRPRKEPQESKTKRHGRAPTAYNMFVKQRMNELVGSELEAREKLSIIAQEWMAQKNESSPGR